MSTTERYRKLKRQARRLMMKGDLMRYMHTLRELYSLRTVPVAGA